jgi:hypothetical protein
MISKTAKGMAIAAASLFVLGTTLATPAAAADEAKAACVGGNACKGKSECKAGKNASCKGQNACKGQGMQTMTKADCDKATKK